MLRALHLEFDNDTTARMQEVPAPLRKLDWRNGIQNELKRAA